MKGFPNQVAELPTLTKTVQVIQELLDAGENPKDDGILGEALIRRKILGTGHKPIPIEDYLAQQKAIKKKSDQSYRTRARGLRELFRVLGLLVNTGNDTVAMTPAGRQVAALDDASSAGGLAALS